MELHPPLHLGVVAMGKGAFRSPSTKVAYFTYMVLSIPHKNNFHTYIYDMTVFIELLSNKIFWLPDAQCP